MFHGINWGVVGAWAGALLALGTSIGYAFQRDWRHSLYFFFAFCITVVVIWR
jgi:hypothetical protein